MKMTNGIRISMQYFAEQTKITDLIDPEVMSDMIDAKIESKITVSPFAKIDRTLVGVPGDTITVPQYKYIGDAVDVAEGVEAETVKLETDSTQAKVKKAMKAVEITDEALLSGYGNPAGQATSQLAMSIASKVDADSMDALMKAQLIYDGSASAISYSGIVDAVDKFNEELNTEKAMFINPHQNSQLRKDPNFISADKYDGNVVMTGEIGKIANCRIVPSKKVSLNENDIPEEVKMCCCELAENIFKAEQEGGTQGVSSESVGGWSKSYESSDIRRQNADRAVHDIVYKWLSGTGLLYRGVR